MTRVPASFLCADTPHFGSRRKICTTKQGGSTLNRIDIAIQKPIVLFVKGEQYFEGTGADGTELMTEGTMTISDEAIQLSYQETELTGMAGTTTTFEIRGPRVTLTRSGAVNSQMIFEEGKQHSSLYRTLFGDMTIDIQTSRLRHNITERGGVMEIRYSIAVEHTVTGRNTFRIRVREKT